MKTSRFYFDDIDDIDDNDLVRYKTSYDDCLTITITISNQNY